MFSRPPGFSKIPEACFLYSTRLGSGDPSLAPPQYHEMCLKALKLIDEHIEGLNEDGTLIVQIDPVEYQEVELVKLEETEQRKYGSALIVFYDRAD
jgi:hypothetical protein